jgi:hypothetical protein
MKGVGWEKGGQDDMSPAMTKPQQPLATGFTTAEREYIRRELNMFFSTYPSVAEGFRLKTWRGGPQAGQPKIPPTAKGLLERDLMRLDTGGRLPRLFFTDAGLAEHVGPPFGRSRKVCPYSAGAGDRPAGSASRRGNLTEVVPILWTGRRHG